MKSKYLRPVAGFVLAVFSIGGLLLFVEEYAKSYFRNTVKDEVLRRDTSDDVVYEVPAGDYLSVKTCQRLCYTALQRRIPRRYSRSRASVSKIP